MTSLTDENGHATQNSFNLLYEPTGKILPDGSSTETRQYDTAGNLTSLTHFSGVTTTFNYDPMNRLLSRVPDPSTGEVTESFTYTGTGKRQTMTDTSGTTNYTYDSLDRLTQKATPEGTLNYTYDSAGNLATMTSADGIVNVSYTYDNLNRLSTVADNRLGGSSNTTTYSYDTANNLATVTYPNTLQSTFQYDSLNRLTSMTASNTGYGYTLGTDGYPNLGHRDERAHGDVELRRHLPADERGCLGGSLEGERQRQLWARSGREPALGYFDTAGDELSQL